MGRKIQIRIDKKGGQTVDAIGFKGGKCKEATAFLLKDKEGKEEIKADFYEEPHERELELE